MFEIDKVFGVSTLFCVRDSSVEDTRPFLRIERRRVWKCANPKIEGNRLFRFIKFGSIQALIDLQRIIILLEFDILYIIQIVSSLCEIWLLGAEELTLSIDHMIEQRFLITVLNEKSSLLLSIPVRSFQQFRSLRLAVSSHIKVFCVIMESYELEGTSNR